MIAWRWGIAVHCCVLLSALVHGEDSDDSPARTSPMLPAQLACRGCPAAALSRDLILGCPAAGGRPGGGRHPSVYVGELPAKYNFDLLYDADTTACSDPSVIEELLANPLGRVADYRQPDSPLRQTSYYALAVHAHMQMLRSPLRWASPVLHVLSWLALTCWKRRFNHELSYHLSRHRRPEQI